MLGRLRIGVDDTIAICNEILRAVSSQGRDDTADAAKRDQATLRDAIAAAFEFHGISITEAFFAHNDHGCRVFVFPLPPLPPSQRGSVPAGRLETN
jgi:hypothetical protein